jgi:hypothetical protein
MWGGLGGGDGGETAVGVYHLREEERNKCNKNKWAKLWIGLFFCK